MKINLRKANKFEIKDFPKAIATITIGIHEAQLTKNDILDLQRKLNKFDITDVIKSVCPNCKSDNIFKHHGAMNECIDCGNEWQTVL